MWSAADLGARERFNLSEAARLKRARAHAHTFNNLESEPARCVQDIE